MRLLARVGCESAVLNLHHLGDSISAHFGSAYHGLPITYSPEEEIQGTLGALYPLRSHLAECDLVLLVNGDTLCKWPWKAMVKKHLRSGADATLLVHRRASSELLGGPVGIDAGNQVVQLRDSAPTGEVAKRHIFAGAHVFSPRLLDRLEPGTGDIIGDFYIPLLREEGRIHAVVTGRKWHDLGTPRRYLEAALDWARGRGRLPGLKSRGVIAAGTEIVDSAVVHSSIIETGCVVGEGARIEGSLLMWNARVPSGSTIHGSIIGPEVQLPASARIDRRLVTRIQSGYPPGDRDSVMGELVYTPLDRG